MRNKTFVIVDDDSDDVQLFKEALNQVNSAVVCCHCENGQSLFDLLKSGIRPDVIFLDVNMPVIDGWECLRLLKLHDEYAAFPVIIYSTASVDRQTQKALSLGAVAFISKPSTFVEIKQMLELVCGGLDGELSKSLQHL
jgi:CheY-like chemotaxis protein